ncbi:MAG: Lrp/AsnC family transcriptional regulator [Sulfolobales archaeon]
MVSKKVEYIDDVDKSILKILLANGRVPYRRIAEELNLSESTIYLRIKKLSRLGILKGFTINIDLSRLGFIIVAFILLKVSPKNYEESLRHIAAHPGVIEAYEVSGEHQVLVKAIAQDNKELAKLVDGLGNIDGLVEVKLLYVLRTLRTPYEVVEILSHTSI